ncbi:GlxA family transcriptional regulator [Aminobacter aminovorans]|uniref:AraC family transcriptional regulator n=1 Tax=Aminobacter aminovorans TaxID=83263 RepID=A0AAC8YP23_AMIAI|nr:GlxA family transcriptional regulator [Aminobacter aminovorans]AMS41574.1 AraC family transcriptional regulator [Aminobacter aminovorans]MBB3704077.1 transcriptional regulator GlxA family with amidase domain [Aminobacter aminovorans]
MNAPNWQAAFSAVVSLPDADGTALLPGPSSVTEFLVLVLPGFSQLCLAALIEPLRLANSLTRSTMFAWKLISLDGNPVGCASGLTVGVSGSLDAAKGILPNVSLVLCAGENVERHGGAELRRSLRRMVRAKVPIYALGTATWLLAEAAVLRDARCTIHWGRMAALAERFEELAVEDALFVRDGQIVTCAGEFAAFDLAMDLVHKRDGGSLAARICQHVAADRWRDGASCQAAPPGLRYNAAGKRLLPIIKLMEATLEDPLSLEEISRSVAISRRQIERLFERHLARTPFQHYVALRLTKARQLIELTDMQIMDVAVACGFVSSSHFSKTFRDHFGMLPSELRMLDRA